MDELAIRRAVEHSGYKAAVLVGSAPRALLNANVPFLVLHDGERGVAASEEELVQTLRDWRKSFLGQGNYFPAVIIGEEFQEACEVYRHLAQERLGIAFEVWTARTLHDHMQLSLR